MRVQGHCAPRLPSGCHVGLGRAAACWLSRSSFSKQPLLICSSVVRLPRPALAIARHQEPVVVRRRAAGSSVRDTVLLLSLRYSRRRRRPDARGGAGGGGAGAGPRDAGQDPRQPGLGAGATTWWPSRSRPAPRCRWPGSRSARRSPARSCPSAAWPWSATACCCAARRAQRPAPIDRRRAPAVGGEPASGALLAAGRALRS